MNKVKCKTLAVIPEGCCAMALCIFTGVSPRLEIQIRLFCRNVLLDHWQSSRDTLFWLTRILKPWPMVNQARLIYIIYGPLTLDGRLLITAMIVVMYGKSLSLPTSVLIKTGLTIRDLVLKPQLQSSYDSKIKNRRQLETSNLRILQRHCIILVSCYFLVLQNYTEFSSFK